MRAGKWLIVAGAGALLAIIVSISLAADPATNVFAGRWVTDAGGAAGGADFSVVDDASGAAALTSLHGTPCASPTVYYRVIYHDTGGTGTMAGCTVGSPAHFVGRYASDAGAGGGDVNITYTSGAFSGSYTYDAIAGSSYPYTGTFSAHFADDGCCPAPPATTTGTTGTTSTTTTNVQPPVVPDATVPKAGTPISYAAPAPGDANAYRPPKLGPKTKKLTGEIHFVDDNGNPIAGPDAAALEADDLNEKAGLICSMLVFGDQDLGEYAPVQLRSVAVCVDAVVRILARADEIKKAKGGGRSVRALAQTRCFHATKTPKYAPFLVTCTPIENGVKVVVKARSKTKRLRDAFRGTPRLVVGRSSLDTAGPGDRMNVLWSASSKR